MPRREEIAKFQAASTRQLHEKQALLFVVKTNEKKKNRSEECVCDVCEAQGSSLLDDRESHPSVQVSSSYIHNKNKSKKRW